MIDFWLTVGTLVADTRLWPLVKADGPEYKRIGLKRIWGDGKIDDAPFMGEFLEIPTEKQQAVLHGFFKTHYPGFAVPISAYCAGSLCDLATSKFGPDRTLTFEDVLVVHQKAVAMLVEQWKPTLNAGFLAVVGLIMFDRQVRGNAANATIDGVASALYFKPTPEQVAALQHFAKHVNNGAQVQYDMEVSTSWDYGCRQVLSFYEKFPRSLA